MKFASQNQSCTLSGGRTQQVGCFGAKQQLADMVSVTGKCLPGPQAMSKPNKHQWLLLCLSHSALPGIHGYLHVVLPEHSQLSKQKHQPVKNLLGKREPST